MPFLQNHSDITFKIRRTLGLFSHFVETNSWGVCNHFVAGANFILQNGVHNSTHPVNHSNGHGENGGTLGMVPLIINPL